MRTAAFVLLFLFDSALPGAFAAPSRDGIDFPELVRLAEVYRAVRHDTTAQIEAAWGDDYASLRVVELHATRNRFLVGSLASDGTQQIVVRGTANVVNALYDAEARMVWNEALGMRVHRGFSAMAGELLESVRPLLRRDAGIVIYGHSLGAAEAVLLGILLDREGFAVLRVYASGMPKVTDAMGAALWTGFPLLRISCEHDPVPFLPPRVAAPERPYMHFGREIILLDGTLYADAPGHTIVEEQAGSVWGVLKQTGARAAIREHLIGSYLEKLRPKVRGAEKVPWPGAAPGPAPTPAS
jgi:triacylglycerol lipase